MAAGQKTGGRVKGTPNLVTHNTRNLLLSILEGELKSGRVQRELAQAEGRDYLYLLFRLAQLVLPKIKAQQSPEITEPVLFQPVIFMPASFEELQSHEIFEKMKNDLENQFNELMKSHFPDFIQGDNSTNEREEDFREGLKEGENGEKLALP